MDQLARAGLGLSEKQQRQRTVLEWVSLGVLFLAGCSYFAWANYDGYRAIGFDEEQRLRAQATLVEQNLDRQMVAVARSLAAIRDSLPIYLAQGLPAPLVGRTLQALCDANPGVRVILVLDASGRVVASSRPTNLGVDLSGSERLRVARQGADPAALYVSSLFAAPSGMVSMSLGKVAVDATGRMTHGVFAILSPDYFNTVLSSVRYAPDMLSAITHADGTILFRTPDHQGIIGTSLDRPGSFFRAHMESGDPATVHVGRTAATGEDRMVVLRTIAPPDLRMDRPLVVAISRTKEALYHAWYQGMVTQGTLLYLIFIAASVILALIQGRRMAFEQIAAFHLRELLAEKEKVELANRCKSTFLAAMSHDLRTPLNAIIGFSDLIVMRIHGDAIDPRYVDYASHVNESGHHLLDLVGDLLDISAIELGNVRLRPQRAAVHDIVRRSSDLIRLRAEENGVHLGVDTTTAPDHLHTDVQRLMQILVNLLTNAVKFTPPGGSVDLAVSRLADGGVAFVVADTGVGMDEAGIDRALTLFGATDGTSFRPHEGNGLGLPISRRLAELLGGALAIESAPGRGTRVTVTLPPAVVAA